MYLDLVSKYKSQHKFKLFSYNLHPDRLELLIETGDDATISDIMHDLNSLYTKYFNGRYQKRGHLFESRFKSVLVEKANYLLSMTRHIHLKDIQNPYSSFYIYMGGKQSHMSFPNADFLSSPKSLIGDPDTGSPIKDFGDDMKGLDLSAEVKEVLSFLKTKDDDKAYERYVLEGDKKEIEELEKSLKRAQVLGSEKFELAVKNRVQQHVEQQKEETAPAKTNPVILFVVGALVLVVTSAAIYLYVSKRKIESQYASILKQKEAEFTEKTKFENRSPIALSELNGTEWQIEKIALPVSGAQGSTKDTLHFSNNQFYSEEFLNKGFKPTNVSVTRQANGVVTWETLQSNNAGDSVSWRGDWQDNVMKGVLSVTLAGQKPHDYSFFSVKWVYGGVQ